MFNSRRCFQGLPWLILLLAICPFAVRAQQSALVGTVTDSTGAAAVGATITAKNVNTGEVRDASSNDVGEYAIPNLKAGIYEVSAEKQGFQRRVVERVVLDVQSNRSVDLVLSLGQVTEQVTVSASPSELQTTESSVSTLFETKLVNEIPLNGRNFLQLQLLSPGVTLARGGTFTAVQIAAQNTSIGGGNFSVNGMRDVYNDYILDGISFKDWIHGTNGMNPSVDAIQEFRLSTSNYTAEFGATAGGLVNMTTKSGTNQLHGVIYEFLRNDKFDATNFFTNAAGQRKPPLRRNQFGGTLGGPVRHNKTFFFGSYDGFRERRTTTNFNTYPTVAMHSGDFSELLSLPNPIVIHDPKTGVPYPGNVIPQDQILGVMQAYLDKYIPAPNRPGLVNNYVVPLSRSNTTNQYLGRLDHVISDKMQVYGHYVLNQIQNAQQPINPNFSHKERNFDHNGTLHFTDTISPTTVLDLHIGYNLFKQITSQNLEGTTPNISRDLLGINGVSQDPRASGTPAFATSGFGGLDAASTPRQWFSERFEYGGSVSLVRGKHLIRAGMNAVRHHETFPEIILPNGFFAFDGTFTGYSLADMLIGIPSNFELSPEIFDPQYRQTELMPWVQDDWRVTPRLTLNLGLRYEWRPWPVSKSNAIANIVLPPGGGQASIQLAGPCTPDLPVRRCETTLPTFISKTRSTLDSTDKNNFAPRVGFAYRLDNSGRTVLRGGYGIFYQPEPFNQFIFLAINPPFVSFYNRFINTSNFQSFDFTNPTAGIPAGGIQFSNIGQNSRTPYLQAWNFGVQRDLGAGFILDVSYVGNKDTKLWARTWPNQPTPAPGDIDSRRPYTNVSTVAGNEAIGNANYNGLQVKVDKRFSKGLSILGAYTWSKSITDSQAAETGAFVPDLQDTRNRRANRGLWSADTRHRMTISTLYELPFGAGRRFFSSTHGVPGKLVSGWQVGAIATAQSGQPLTVTLPFDNPNVGEGTKLPNLIGNPNNGPKTVAQFFNTAAFAVPLQYTFGNEGIGVVTGPNLIDVDISLIKNTSISERINLQFRAEAFNAANHAILGDPVTDFGTPQFGQITNTRLDNREIQFALRLVF